MTKSDLPTFAVAVAVAFIGGVVVGNTTADGAEKTFSPDSFIPITHYECPDSIPLNCGKWEAPATFMLIMLKRDGRSQTEQFFVGRAPAIGEPVEFVYVGNSLDGSMALQLKVRE